MRFLLRYPLRLLGGLTDRLAAVAGAVALSQFPGFVRHYLQRLGGHATEAGKGVADWQEIADSATCGSLPDLIAQYRASALPEVVEAGNKCAVDLARFTELQASFDALSNATAWSRGWVFLQRFDAEVFGATVRSFVPNVPLDVESLCYAAAGLVLAIVLFAAVRSLTARTARKTVAMVKGRLRRPQAPPSAAIEE